MKELGHHHCYWQGLKGRQSRSACDGKDQVCRHSYPRLSSEEGRGSGEAGHIPLLSSIAYLALLVDQKWEQRL